MIKTAILVPQSSACGTFYTKNSLGFETEQPVEERAIALDRDTHIFGGNIILSAFPLIFQGHPFVGKAPGDTLDHICDQLISFFNGGARIIHKSALDIQPVGPKFLCLSVLK